ncbi:microfibril-associated glycoprotein 4-like [Megalops cyprinoides]|uniref:microfibril-associated glycoprotein 4-like n=1 Tax=Megalops cyprinoides TaxID=118141 RepID=UPI001863DC3B|nr:microfibril-associated glycoprotein 4-like [Megalops cyprinoides]
MTVPVLLFLLLPVAILSLPVKKYQPMDCEDVYYNGSTESRVYTIFPAGQHSPVQVFCEMGCEEDSDGGRWTVIQRRMDGSVNFYKPWEQYKNGFGNVSGEYWLGLENIFLLTWAKKYELKVDMEDFEGGKVHATYATFAIDSEADGYRLQLGKYIDGGAGDALSYHNQQKFSTFDKDQDNYYYYYYYSYYNCAERHQGGFWFNSCMNANPNGLYVWGQTSNYDIGVKWQTWKSYYSLKSITMKIRPLSLDDVEDNKGPVSAIP